MKPPRNGSLTVTRGPNCSRKLRSRQASHSSGHVPSALPELDIEGVYQTTWGQQLAVTAARYAAAGHSTDTTKVMIWTTFGF